MGFTVTKESVLEDFQKMQGLCVFMEDQDRIRLRFLGLYTTGNKIRRESNERGSVGYGEG